MRRTLPGRTTRAFAHGSLVPTLGLGLVLGLAGCGGGGRQEPPPSNPVPPTEVSIAPTPGKTVEEVLAAYEAARGGRDKIAAIASLRMKGTYRRNDEGETPVTVERKNPDKFRRDLEDPNAPVTVGFDGTTAWQRGGPGGATQVSQLPPETAERLKKSADIGGPLVDAVAKGATATLLGTATVDGAATWAVELVSGGEKATYFIDQKSGLLIRSHEPIPSSDGPTTAEITYGDYRDEGGIQWPTHIVFTTPANGQVQTFTWKQIEVGAPIDDSRFAMPPS